MGSMQDCGSLSFAVRRAWLSMRTAIGADLKAFGLSVPQYATLMILEEEPDSSSADIARHVGSSRQAAHEMLTGLERDGLIVRSPHPTDRRSQQLRLTELGRSRLSEAVVAVARRESEIEAAFTPAQRATVREWLEGVADACDWTDVRVPPPGRV